MLRKVAAGPGNRDPTWHIGEIADVTEIQRKVEYIVLYNAYDRFLAEKEKYPRQIAVYEKLMSEGELIYDSDNMQTMSRGSMVRIYKVNFQQQSSLTLFSLN